MAQIVVTTKRTDSTQPWFEVTPEIIASLTPDEANTLTVVNNTIQSLPGFQGSTKQIVDDYTMIITTTFDTIENAQNADLLFNPPPANTVFHDREVIMKTLRENANVNYTYTRTII